MSPWMGPLLDQEVDDLRQRHVEQRRSLGAWMHDSIQIEPGRGEQHLQIARTVGPCPDLPSVCPEGRTERKPAVRRVQTPSWSGLSGRSRHTPHIGLDSPSAGDLVVAFEVGKTSDIVADRRAFRTASTGAEVDGNLVPGDHASPTPVE